MDIHQNRTQTRSVHLGALFSLLLLLTWVTLQAIPIRVAAVGQTTSGHPAVIDQANLFSEEDLQDLVARTEEMNDRWGMDVVVVTTQDAEGKSSRDYADDYFDYNGYGTGDAYDGMLFLIDMDNRNIWLSTTGDAIRRMTDSRIDTVLDRAIEPMYDSDYDGAVRSFLTETDRLIGPRRFQLKHALAGSVAGGAVFLIFFMSNRSRYKKRSQKWNYDLQKMTDAQFSVFNTALVDQFVTRRRRPQQASSGGRGGGGGSSTHSGSSGRSHGGGGRSF